WDSGNLRSAFRLMLSAAKLGDTAAMSTSGTSMMRGLVSGTTAKWRCFGTAKLIAGAIFAGASNIGVVYRMENKPRRALRWFERAVALGDTDANLEIAQVYIRDLEDP